MDLFYEENPYFQDGYITEEQYISYNDEDNYNYGNNPQGDGGNGEELEYEEDFNQEFGYEEDFSQGVEEYKELDDVEVSREWEEEGRGEGGEYKYKEPEQDYQRRTQMFDEGERDSPYWESPPQSPF